jgi:cell division protein FtsZ
MVKKIKKKNKKIPSQDLKVKVKKRVEKEDFDKIKKIKIKIIGIGGGGGTIVSEMASKLLGVSFTVANTDIQALKTVNKKIDCFQFGQNLTQGLGTGMNVNLGREAAQNEKDKIKKICQNYDLCIIVACLGGGTGSGAAPVFAKISKELGNLTYGIFTLPFEFEGEKKIEIAKETLKETKDYLDAVTFIPNEKVFQIVDKNVPLKESLSLINKNLIKSLEGLIETIYKPGLINIDFADLKTVFRVKGKLAYLNTIEISKKDDSIKDLMTQFLNSSFYPYTVQGAKGVLFNIAGKKNLFLSEVNQISKSVLGVISPEAKIIFGISINQNLEPVIKTTLLAVGCDDVENRQEKYEPVQNLKKEIIKKSPAPVVTKKKKKKEKIKNKEDRARKNALQIKIESQELEKETEKEILNKEKFWETPAFLRRKIIK